MEVIKRGHLTSCPVAPPTASILLGREADALPDPQACLLLLFTAADVIAAYRRGHGTKRTKTQRRKSANLPKLQRGFVIILIIAILHIMDLPFSGKIKRSRRSSGVTDKGLVATALATRGNRSFI